MRKKKGKGKQNRREPNCEGRRKKKRKKGELLRREKREPNGGEEKI